MAPQHWQQVKEILGEALDRQEPARSAYLNSVCGEKTDVRREIEAYLSVSGDTIEECANSLQRTLLAPMNPLIGARIGAYRIEREIGHGGMGAVYLARRADGEFEKRVAIKLLNRHIASDDIVRRFRSERQILARLEHPSIARLIDAGTSKDGVPYLIMEYVEGSPITRFAWDRNLPLPDRLELFLKVCLAVECAHRHLVIHRDLKPNNILVNEEGEPKLLDFGVAKLYQKEDAAGNTVASQRRLTPQYASPEQIRGQAVTQSCDIYALGVILYELLTGQVPYCISANYFSFDQIAQFLVENTALRPSLTAKDPATQRQLRGRIDEILLRALEKEPAGRFQSVGDLAREIRSYLKERSGGDGTIAELRRKCRRTPAVRRVATLFVALALSGGAFYAWRHDASLPGVASSTETSFTSSVHRLAILPLTQVGQEAKNQSLGLGMSDAIIGRMSGLTNLIVLPTATVSRFAGSQVDSLKAAHDLQVDAVLCGTIQRADNRLRITVQLVDVKSRQTLWADTFDQAYTDVFAMQDSISQRVAIALSSNLSDEDQRNLVKHSTGSTGAYDLYLLGLAQYNQRTKQGLASAIDYFQRAIKEDPRYALAYALMSDAYSLECYYSFLPPQESLPRARAAAEEALRIDSSLAEAYLALAMVQPMPDVRKEAERLLRRALELNPNLAIAHLRYAWRRCASGNLDEALSEMKRAQELDPLSSTTNSALGMVYAFAHQFGPALTYSERAAQLNPNEPFIQSNLGNMYLLNGRTEEAVAKYRRATELDPSSEADNLASIALALWRAKAEEQARKVTDDVLKLAQEGKVDPYNLALIYAERGDKDKAFKWFAQALDKGIHSPGLVRYDALLDPLRSDPRFDDLVKQDRSSKR